MGKISNMNQKVGKNYGDNHDRIFGMLKHSTKPGTETVKKCPVCKKNKGIDTFIVNHRDVGVCRACREGKR